MPYPPPGIGIGPGREPGDGPLWAEGGFTVRVRAPGGATGPAITCRRPFGVVGRVEGADVRIDDRAVSARHVYLHLDGRGLFAVDLATRTGTRVGPRRRPVGWLRPGQALEVAGHVVELVEAHVAGADPAGFAADPDADPLADCGAAPLARVTLYPAHAPEAPLVLSSELVFVGRSTSCGVRVEGAAALRTHCVLVRSGPGAYLVDLAGRGTWLNDHPLREAAALGDGDALMIGAARFECRVAPPGAGRMLAPVLGQAPPAPLPRAEVLPATAAPPPLPPDLIPPENQAALLAWMMGVLQAGQGEILRRQVAFQEEVTAVLREVHRASQETLGRHAERVEAMHRELASLREEIRRQFGPTAPPPRPAPPPAPKGPPLRIDRPPAPTQDPTSAAAWLLSRVNQLEEENRSTWRDLLGRLGRR